MKTHYRVFFEYIKWKNNWDDLCNRCGQCCYTRSLSPTGKVVIDYSEPCEFLEKDTHLCRVFENRFSKCSNCGSVNLFRALFSPILPPKCAYVQTFRVWLHKG